MVAAQGILRCHLWDLYGSNQEVIDALQSNNVDIILVHIFLFNLVKYLNSMYNYL